MSRRPLALAAALLLLLLAAAAVAVVDDAVRPGAGEELAGVGSSAVKSAMAAGADPDPSSSVDGVPADPAPDARG
ncbi:uncharacterized protein LOC121055382 [Oryza brachyantha]|uniref:uncharacterized protein LOC121055382 n=1 Tax=Oryza brachyantha TaxID=4533 RepID=UPI001ADAC58D|nr:uncharacterized protein LOC121055382 [Oryza brachyantha]